MGGPSGSGKTLSSLLMAYGLVKGEHPEWPDDKIWENICIIDTENGSASLYANSSVGQYKTGSYFTIPMEPPYTFESYEAAIHAAEDANIKVIIIDSLTHLWQGEGGALDMQSKVASARYQGNSYMAWRDITPKLNHLMDVILQSPCHIIGNIRAKTDYVQEKNAAGKTVVKNVGMGLQMRDGVEFEFSTVFMLDQDHIANATKDRTGLFDGKYFTITPETGKEIYRWLASSDSASVPEKKTAPAPVKTEPEPAETTDAVTVEQVDALIKSRVAGVTPEEKKQIIAELKEIAGTANYMKITDPGVLKAIYDHFNG